MKIGAIDIVKNKTVERVILQNIATRTISAKFLSGKYGVVVFENALVSHVTQSATISESLNDMPIVFRKFTSLIFAEDSELLEEK